MNTFGHIYRLTSFGESHGAAIGGVIDGVPAGIEIDLAEIQTELDRRRPGQSAIVTGRRESDRVKILSGIFEGRTLGTPIGFIIENSDHHSNDYETMRHCYRPSHADYTYQVKYGIRDHRGGGRSSARETASRVVAGAIAKQILKRKGINVAAYTSQVGYVALNADYRSLDLTMTETNPVRCPDENVADKMEALILEVKSQGDTVGGIVSCVVTGVPAGLGEPVFGKLHARLADAMLSINAAKGFDYGMGFAGASMRGSETIDRFICDGDKIHTETNNSGGIQGGISNGEDIYFRVAFKPVATLLQEVTTITDSGERMTLKVKGRHDPCVVPRAVPVVEAMTAMVILDAVLLDKTTHI
ncbi:MAG: chorismate synthase [Muribaculaceae bacterium]|nr:chorismate synthase [Muribaculaceae bacterium]